MAMDFILGLIIGVCLGVVGLFVVAWRLVSKAPEAKPQGLAATSVSVNGNGSYPTLQEQLAIFKQTDGRA